MTLLHLSDTHFGTERAGVVQALLALHRQVAPELVVHSGDITQRATPTQFARAADFVGQLGGAKWLAVPGNHDVPLIDLFTRLTRPWSRYRRWIGPLESEVDSANWLVIAVNTVQPRRHKDGAVSRARIDAVAERLRRADRGQLRIVVGHHPFAVTRPEDESNRAQNGARAIDAWVDAGADLLLGGHIHLPFLLPLTVSGAMQSRPVWQLQAGTAISSRLRGGTPNSVNLIRPRKPAIPSLHARSCVVERWDYDEDRGRFAIASATTLDFDEGKSPLLSSPPGEESKRGNSTIDGSVPDAVS